MKIYKVNKSTWPLSDENTVQLHFQVCFLCVGRMSLSILNEFLGKFQRGKIYIFEGTAVE